MKFTIRTFFGISCLLIVPTTGGAQSIETTNLPANHRALDGQPTKAANSADGFTGEDGVLRTSLLTTGMSFSRSSSTPDFDVAPIYGELAKDDYNRAVELARLLQGEASRANAVIAIARAVIEEKTK